MLNAPERFKMTTGTHQLVRTSSYRARAARSSARPSVWLDRTENQKRVTHMNSSNGTVVRPAKNTEPKHQRGVRLSHAPPAQTEHTCSQNLQFLSPNRAGTPPERATDTPAIPPQTTDGFSASRASREINRNSESKMKLPLS